MRPYFLLAFMTVFVAGMSGCVMVQPYEREYLADPIMQWVDDPEEEAYNQHMHKALSQSGAGLSSGGSGCGCEQ